FNPVYPY
nr:Chain X, Fiber protein [Human adenovirus 41]